MYFKSQVLIKINKMFKRKLRIKLPNIVLPGRLATPEQ